MKALDESPAGDARRARRDAAPAGAGSVRQQGRSVLSEARLLGSWVRERFFLMWVGLLLVLYALALQTPLWHDLDVGASAAVQPAQPNSFVHLVGRAFSEPVGRPYDQVFWEQVYPPEVSGDVTFRWTEPQASLVYRGLAPGPAVLRLRMHGAVTGAATTAQLRVAGRTLAAFPVAYPLHHYAFVVDPSLWAGDSLRLDLESTVFVPGEEDPRSLGVAVDQVTLSGAGWAWPSGVPRTALFLAGTAAFLYLSLRRAGLGETPPRYGDRWALAAAVAASLWGGLVFLALLLPSRPFVAAYAGGLFVASALSYPLLLLTLAAARSLYHRAGVVLDRRTWQWLAVLFLAAFLLRFGGALSPRYASHDGPFHANRLLFAEEGELFFEHQSIEAGMRSDPYPGALYLTLLPLTVVVDNPDVLLAFSLAWLAAGELFLVWFLARQVLAARASRWAVLLYAAFPIALSAFWFGIYANLFANGVSLLLAVGVVLAWRGRLRTSPSLWIPLFSLLFLAHFGMLILWGPLLLLWGGLLYVQGHPVRRLGLRRLFLSALMALVLAVGLYYSYFRSFFGGMGGALAEVLADVESVADGVSWARTLAEARVWWRWGLVADYAGVGIPLGLLGLGLLGRPFRRTPVAQWALTAVGVATLFWAVSMATAYFTRYMLFLLPVAAIGSAQVMALVWERGRAGRVLVAALLLYICAITGVLWFGLCLLGWHPPHVL